MSHPEESLAPYVDGTLDETERAEVEAHLASCPVCRDDVELARRGAAVLAALPELDVPLGSVRPGIGRERTSGRRRVRVEWVAGLAAAASIAAIFALVALSGKTPGGGLATGPASAGRIRAAELAPTIVKQSRLDYDAASIRQLAASIAANLGRAHRAAGANPAEGAGGSQGGSSGGGGGVGGATGGTTVTSGGGVAAGSSHTVAKAPSSDQSLKFGSATAPAPAACLRLGAGLPRSARPVEVIEARYGGRPAYIGAFLRDGALPNALVIWVVSRTTCELLSTARQSLR